MSGSGPVRPQSRQLSVAAARDDYRGDIRDGRRLDIRAEIGKRFTPEFDASFGGRYDRRYGRNDEPVVPGISGNVFDLRGESEGVKGAGEHRLARLGEEREALHQACGSAPLLGIRCARGMEEDPQLDDVGDAVAGHQLPRVV